MNDRSCCSIFGGAFGLVSVLDFGHSNRREVLSHYCCCCCFNHFLHIIIIFYLFIYLFYFWLCWVFVAARGLFSSCGERGLLFVAERGLLFVAVRGLWVLGLSSCGSRALERRLSSCGAQA